MTILAVDTHPGRLRELAGCLREAFPKAEVAAFCVPALAVQHSFRSEVSLVFARSEMKRLGGVQVAQAVQFYHPRAKAFLMTDEKTPKRVFRHRALSGFLSGPPTAAAIRAAVAAADGAAQNGDTNGKMEG